MGPTFRFTGLIVGKNKHDSKFENRLIGILWDKINFAI